MPRKRGRFLAVVASPPSDEFSPILILITLGLFGRA